MALRPTRFIVPVVALLLVVAAGSTMLLARTTPKRLHYPGGKRFAFTIVDDTDMVTLERVRPVYEALERYGFRTTKTTWVYRSNNEGHEANRGDSLEDPDYRAFILGLQAKGFEIALHGVRGGSSRREDTLAGLQEFRTLLGHDPKLFVNHSVNEENLYWGRSLYDFPPYQWLAGLFIKYPFTGHVEASPYFWGDIARERVQFVRRFTFDDINLLAENPSFPYRLHDKPYVNYWFPTSNGNRVIEFHKLLSPENLDRLEQEGGVCLVYAHLGSGSFNRKDGQPGVDPRFEQRLKELSARNGWFVPASEILEFLKSQEGWTGELPWLERLQVDTRFLYGRVVYGHE